MRFNVGQQNGQQANQGQKRAEAEDKFNAGSIRQMAEGSRADTGNAEGKSEKQPGNHADFSRHKFLRIHQDGGKRRRQNDADENREDYRSHQADMRQ